MQIIKKKKKKELMQIFGYEFCDHLIDILKKVKSMMK